MIFSFAKVKEHQIIIKGFDREDQEIRMKRERVKKDLHMMSKVLFMSSVKDVNNLSAGDLVSNSPEESPCSSILYLFSFTNLFQ